MLPCSINTQIHYSNSSVKCCLPVFVVIWENKSILVLASTEICTKGKNVQDEINTENAAEILVSSQQELGETLTTPCFSKVNHKYLMIALLYFTLYYSYLWISHIFFFFRATPAAHEVPRLVVKSELRLPASATATAMLDLNSICNLHHSSHHQISNSLGEARDQTHIFMDTSQVFFGCSMMGTPSHIFLTKLPAFICLKERIHHTFLSSGSHTSTSHLVSKTVSCTE